VPYFFAVVTIGAFSFPSDVFLLCKPSAHKCSHGSNDRRREKQFFSLAFFIEIIMPEMMDKGNNCNTLIIIGIYGWFPEVRGWMAPSYFERNV
jgi:hypothetical protein